MHQIPIVDFDKCGIHHSAVNENDTMFVGQQICNAFENIGFVYLINTGISSSAVDEVNRITESFFLKSPEEKARYSRSAAKNFGYDCLAKERLGVGKPGDFKESFNISGRVVSDPNTRWPDDLVPGFSTTTVTFMKDCRALALRIMEALSYALELPNSKHLAELHSSILEPNNHSSLRCLMYPPVTDELEEGQVRLLEHTDYGSLTLLFQDLVGGLQIRSTDGDYIDAVPIKDSVLINVADILQYWTNGKLRSTPHRILAPSDPVQKSATRRSIAFFVHPSEDLPIAETVVKRDLANNNVTLLNMSTDDLKGMTVGQYVQRIFDKTYS